MGSCAPTGETRRRAPCAVAASRLHSLTGGGACTRARAQDDNAGGKIGKTMDTWPGQHTNSFLSHAQVVKRLKTVPQRLRDGKIVRDNSLGLLKMARWLWERCPLSPLSPPACLPTRPAPSLPACVPAHSPHASSQLADPPGVPALLCLLCLLRCCDCCACCARAETSRA